MFSEDEVNYIRSQRLARVATVSGDGQPDLVPVGFEFDGSHFYIGGFNPASTRRTRNIQAGNTKVALVIDDLASVDPWSPRFVRVYGTVELVDRQTPSGVKPIMKITPTVSWSVNLPGQALRGNHDGFDAHRTVHHQPES